MTGLSCAAIRKAPHVAAARVELEAGTTLTVLRRPQQNWGIAICKDMDFESPARLYGETGTGLMLVPAWDFVVDRSWHGHIGVMRGVEDGFSIARTEERLPDSRR